jgi:type IV fimbrial biogenesis protein FimT
MKESRGFTLIELLTVLTVAVVLALVAVPSFVKIAATQKLRSAASVLQVALVTTRSESLKRNDSVRLQPASGTQWNAGFNIVDKNNNVLSTYPTASGLTISGPASITYQGSGRITATAGTIFKITSSSISDIRCISINPTGAPSVSTSGC